MKQEKPILTFNIAGLVHYSWQALWSTLTHKDENINHNLFTFKKRYCLRCQDRTWHLLNKWGTFFCLPCRLE